MPALEKDFAAVVPFPIADYRASRDPDFLPDFDQQLAASISSTAAASPAPCTTAYQLKRKSAGQIACKAV